MAGVKFRDGAHCITQPVPPTPLYASTVTCQETILTSWLNLELRGGRGAPRHQEGVERGTQGTSWVGQIQTRNGVFPKSCRS